MLMLRVPALVLRLLVLAPRGGPELWPAHWLARPHWLARRAAEPAWLPRSRPRAAPETRPPPRPTRWTRAARPPAWRAPVRAALRPTARRGPRRQRRLPDWLPDGAGGRAPASLALPWPATPAAPAKRAMAAAQAGQPGPDVRSGQAGRPGRAGRAGRAQPAGAFPAGSARRALPPAGDVQDRRARVLGPPLLIRRPGREARESRTFAVRHLAPGQQRQEQAMP